MLTPPELQAIRDREQKATEGPWMASCRRSPEPIQWDISALRLENIGEVLFRFPEGQNPKNPDDLQFIAHARQDIPALLQTVEAQQAEIERLRDVMEKAIANLGDWSPGSTNRVACVQALLQAALSPRT